MRNASTTGMFGLMRLGAQMRVRAAFRYSWVYRRNIGFTMREQTIRGFEELAVTFGRRQDHEVCRASGMIKELTGRTHPPARDGGV
jgi:hypothetical protein